MNWIFALLKAFKEFWKIPEGKQFLSGCFIVIGTLAYVVHHLYTKGDIKLEAKDARYGKIIDAKDSTISVLTAQFYTETLRMQKQCDSEKIVERDAKYSALEAQYDEAIRNVNRASIANQQARKNVSRALKEVAK